LQRDLTRAYGSKTARESFLDGGHKPQREKNDDPGTTGDWKKPVHGWDAKKTLQKETAFYKKEELTHREGSDRRKKKEELFKVTRKRGWSLKNFTKRMEGRTGIIKTSETRYRNAPAKARSGKSRRGETQAAGAPNSTEAGKGRRIALTFP